MSQRAWNIVTAIFVLLMLSFIVAYFVLAAAIQDGWNA